MAGRGPGRRYPDKTRNRARRLYAEHGWEIARIARHLDVPVGTCRTWLAELNPKDGHERRYDREAILADHEAGLSRAEIRERHGCSHRFLSDLLSGKLDP